MKLKDVLLIKGSIKQNVFLLLLTTSVIVFLLVNTKIKTLISFTTSFTRQSKPEVQRCSWTYLSPENAKEGRKLLDSITWPDIPPLSKPFSLNLTTSGVKSSFSIVPRSGGWSVGDELTVRIQLRDFYGNPKKSGGDFLIARLHNWFLGAGVVGQVQDHLNGAFTAVFPLLWDGMAEVEVMLVQTSESITVLKRLMEENPDRAFFSSDFRSGQVVEKSICNVCLQPDRGPLCNFTDLHTGEQWFCYKPKTLDCNTRVSHGKAGFTKTITKEEETLFQRGVNMKVPIMAEEKWTVTIWPKADTVKIRSGLSGYYYRDEWRPLEGPSVRPFNNASDITACLKGKRLHMFGDSTIRQYYKYIAAKVPNLLRFDKHSSLQCGPFMAVDHTNDIIMTHRCHGPPIHSNAFLVSQLKYVANELDRLAGEPNTVVVIGVWAHFGPFTMEVYYQRLITIVKAVQRLLNRAPGTKVIVRSANLRGLDLFTSLTNSDWYGLQLDKVLRAVFKNTDVFFLDAWDMVQASFYPHNVHPPQPIIKLMIDRILSYACPKWE